MSSLRKERKIKEINDRIEKYKSMSDEEINKMKEKIFEYCIIDEMLNKNYIPYFYNGCYGGPGQSEDVGYLFSLFFIKSNDQEKDKINKRILKARIIRYLGDFACGEFSRPTFDFVKKEMLNFINKREYDGLENLEFNENKYRLHIIKKLLDDLSLTADDKINKINDIYNNTIDEDIIIDIDEAEEFLSNI